jgi:predicted short-subunit dehydrogenase-like oxidoreductase (DUF2520 family)
VKYRPGGASSEPTDPASDGRPQIAIVGAGAVGTALGVAFSRAGWPVTVVVSRDINRRERFRRLIPGVRAFSEPEDLPDDVGFALVTVPDDAIPDVAARVTLPDGRILVHTSGLLGAEVLAVAGSAASPGRLATSGALGAFHPLVSFTSDVERSVAGLRGATVAIEGDDRVAAVLADLAEAIGCVPLRLPPGSKPAYHAAAVLASGGLVALLDAVAELGSVAGLDEATSIEVFGRLTAQTLVNILAGGLAPALTGPITRGDAGTVAAHLTAIEAVAPGVMELYVASARRNLRIVEERGALSPEQAERVGRVLAKDR